MEYKEAKEKFIHAWGTLGSSWGINRTMSQIHALLIISPNALTTEEIMQDLNISRGNANMNIRALMDWGLVDKELKPGERKEFFSAKKDITAIGKHIARERKRRELDPVITVLEQLQEVQGTSNEVKEFKKVTGEMQEFAKQVETMLELFAASKQDWLIKAVMKLRS